MKHLLLFFLFSGSLDSFSQDGGSGKIDTTQWWVKNPPFSGCLKPRIPDTMGFHSGMLSTGWVDSSEIKPDTLRATLIVYYDSGPAILHTKPGFVVRDYYWGNETYLDDKKRVIKAPWEVLTYKIKK